MKISVITLHRIFNYGSVFQSYATQKVLQDLGHTPEFVDYFPERITKKRIFIGYSLMLHPTWPGKLKCIIVYFPLRLLNMIIFNRFVKRYLNVSPKKYYSLEELKKNPPEADIYMTGSDQVWNSYYNEYVDPVYFLDYAPEGKPRIAYAASFGKTKLDEQEMQQTKPYISKYKAISTREAQATEILKDLGFDHGVAVLDPTLLLQKQDWQKFVLPRKNKERYLLIYSILSYQQLLEYARAVAKALDLKIYLIGMGYWAEKQVDKTLRFRTPEQFISLFEHADYIITDSFHGTAFSINLNKPFICASPPSFNIRLINILEKTGLKNRMVISGEKFDLDNALSSIDYTCVNEKLNTEREKSIDFLKEALKDN